LTFFFSILSERLLYPCLRPADQAAGPRGASGGCTLGLYV